MIVGLTARMLMAHSSISQLASRPVAGLLVRRCARFAAVVFV
jgi:hypothetical protein